jgi:hypothetical protein
LRRLEDKQAFSQQDFTNKKGAIAGALFVDEGGLTVN